MNDKLDDRHGSYVTLHECRGGWRWIGLRGICVAISARAEFMLLEVLHDPDGYWSVGDRVMVELCESRLGAYDETVAIFA